jgi:hypothetical protein
MRQAQEANKNLRVEEYVIFSSSQDKTMIASGYLFELYSWACADA